MSQRNQPAADATERLVLAVNQIGKDIAMLMTVPPHNEVTDPVLQQLIGMNLVLGRLYWAITGEDFQKLGAKKLLQWSQTLRKRNAIIVN